MIKEYAVVIIGAGPAGLMCASNLNENINYIVLEKNDKPGKKLMMTGGGRCNITNNLDNESFISQCHNNKYIYSMIYNFGPKEVIDFFESNNVKLKIENNKKVFPESNKAVDILNVLKKDVNIKCNQNVIKVLYEENKYTIITQTDKYIANNLVVATGGNSYSFTGSTGDNKKIADQLNIPFVNFYPCEVSLNLDIDKSLAGTSFENIIVKYGKRTSEGSLIFTHSGISGEAVMKMSEYISDNDTIFVDLIPDKTEDELKIILNSMREKELSSFYRMYFSKKFSTFLDKDNKKIKTLNHKEIDKIIFNLKNYEFKNVKRDKLEKAYVTGGGIDMNSINNSTLESKIISNLYFIGEALDIHGPIGGFNLTLALSSGYLVSCALNKNLK